jgi:SAM-dependent methyltransferase
VGVVGKSWQAEKGNSQSKASLILPEIHRLSIGSILDIGTNAGQVARLVSNGNFVVGIDVNLDMRGFKNPLDGVALGNIPFSHEFVRKIPQFDAVLLLSVHHQWIAALPKDQADELFQAGVRLAKKAAFVEFVSLNSKFAGKASFVDNDQESVIEYARGYLRHLIPEGRVKYLGASPESLFEPYRYMFLVELNFNEIAK